MTSNGLAAQTVRPSTPLMPVLVFTFLNSAATGVVTTGFPFLAKAAFGYRIEDNYLLGLLQGATYIVGAIGAGPALRRLMRAMPAMTTRRALVVLMLLMAALCAVPWAAVAWQSGEHADPGAGEGSPPGAAGAWSLWVLIAVYSTLAGVLWPLIESFLSGGRSGPQLRKSIGLFNIVWSGSLVVAFWVIAPLVKSYPLVVILAVGGVHLASLVLLRSFAPHPAEHPEEHHERLPKVYRQLLTVFRLQLPASYLVFSALGPYLPTAAASLRIPTEWETPTASVWLLARVLTFAVLQRWHGWHGRWATAWVGCLLLLLGFGVAVLAPTFVSSLGRGPALIGLFGGLVIFGVGMGTVYTAALYYAMAVGNAGVEAGGTHEALIGLGYTFGPACGLLAASSAGSAMLGQTRFEVGMLIFVAALAVGIAVVSFVMALKASDRPQQDH